MAKDTYPASNCKDYIQQMTKCLGRQEAVDCFTAYLAWVKLLNTDVGSQDNDPKPTSVVSSPRTFTNSRHHLFYCEATSSNLTLYHRQSHHWSWWPQYFRVPQCSHCPVKQGSSYTPQGFDVFALWKQIYLTSQKLVIAMSKTLCMQLAPYSLHLLATTA